MSLEVYETGFDSEEEKAIRGLIKAKVHAEGNIEKLRESMRNLENTVSKELVVSSSMVHVASLIVNRRFERLRESLTNKKVKVMGSAILFQEQDKNVEVDTRRHVYPEEVGRDWKSLDADGASVTILDIQDPRNYKEGLVMSPIAAHFLLMWNVGALGIPCVYSPIAVAKIENPDENFWSSESQPISGAYFETLTAERQALSEPGQSNTVFLPLLNVELRA